jgi:hypothetical protein
MAYGERWIPVALGHCRRPPPAGAENVDLRPFPRDSVQLTIYN